MGVNQLRAVLLQELKELQILDARHLEDFSCAVAQIAPIQCLQKGRVEEDRQRGAVCAKFVLSLMEVHCSFDAYGCVHCPHDCGGNLHMHRWLSVRHPVALWKQSMQARQQLALDRSG